MLGGIAPILIFTFPLKTKSPTFNAIQGVPLIGEFVAKEIGLPIPLYLDENLTGLYIDTETKAIDIDTQVQARNDGGPPIVDQRGLNNLVTVNLIGKRDSIFLATLLAFNDMIFSKLVSKEYNVTYINGATTVFNGLLHGFSTSSGVDDDLIRITMQISKANQQGTKSPSVVSILPKITGATPVSVPGG